MGRFRNWSSEVWYVSTMGSILALVGWGFERLEETLFILITVYLAWHLRQIYRLKKWLSESRDLYPPESRGIWSDIFHNIYLLQRRNRKSKKRLANIVSEFRSSTAALPDGAVVLGEQGDIVWFNKAAEQLLDLNAKKDIGQRVVNLIRHPRFVSFFEAGDYQLPVQITSPFNQSIRLSLRVTPYNKNQKLLVIRNITRLYQLEKVRQDFVANVSHELRTPLTVLNGYVEIFVDAKQDIPPFFHRPLEQMTEQIVRMRALVDDLLALSKLESRDEQVTDKKVYPHKLLKRIVEEARALSNNKHKIDFRSDNEFAIKGNEKELHSAFSNLIFNAVNYSPEGSQILVSWHNSGSYLEMSVEDNGPGIEARHLSRLTERFYRVDDGRNRAVGGTGLGLAIVKHVLERHNSHLQIESDVGVGSRFFCQFKVDSQEQAIDN